MFDREPMIIPTMTIQECVDALRGLGMRTSTERVMLMLERGAYPWGCVVRGKGGSRIVEIYTRKFWEWVDGVAIPENEKTAQGGNP